MFSDITKTMDLKAVNLTPEEQLVMLCCRQAVNQDSSIHIDPLLAHDLDWATIEYMIGLHGIAGFAHAALSKYAQAAHVPHALIERLKQQTIKIAFNNQLYINEFHALVKECNREQIRLMPLKGIAFLTSLYAHNATLRSLSDIDILFNKKDLKRAGDILVALGYERKHMSAREEARSFHSKYHRRVSGFTIPIEVHWDIDHADSPYAIDIAECWLRSHAVTDKTGVYYELSIEDNLILNCVHVLRHARKGPDEILHLKNFCDIAKLITLSDMEIDWECLLRRSRDYKVLRPVAMALYLVRNLLGVTAISMDVAEALKEEGFQNAFELCAVKEYIFGHRNTQKNYLPFWMVDVATKTTLRDKIKIFLDIPTIIANLYDARYFGSSHPSAIRTIVSIAGHYSKKIALTVALWVFSPRKTRQLQHTMVSRNLKASQMIDWLRQ